MFRYAALGDSITAGLGATNLLLAYPAQVVRLTGAKATTTTTNDVLAQPGWTSANLKGAVVESSMPLASASAITIWIGGDNLIWAGSALLNGAPRTIVKTAIKQYALDIATIVTHCRLQSKAPVILCTQYNPFPNTMIAREAIAELNSITTTVATRLKTGLAPVHTWFEGRQPELIAGYQTGTIQEVLRRHTAPIHPNNLGHHVIAENLTPLMVI